MELLSVPLLLPITSSQKVWENTDIVQISAALGEIFNKTISLPDDYSSPVRFWFKREKSVEYINIAKLSYGSFSVTVQIIHSLDYSGAFAMPGKFIIRADVFSDKKTEQQYIKLQHSFPLVASHAGTTYLFNRDVLTKVLMLPREIFDTRKTIVPLASSSLVKWIQSDLTAEDCEFISYIISNCTEMISKLSS